MEIKVLHGSEIAPYIPQLAKLRLCIFCEYPYLYEGSFACEEEYLSMYSSSKNSLLILLEDNHQMIGAATGLPLAECNTEIQSLFLKHNIPTQGIFYFGEILILKAYRNKKMGNALYRQFEKSVKEKRARKIVFYELIREENEEKKPADYFPLDNYWKKKGFVKQEDLITYFAWKEVGSTEEIEHPMVLWTKDLVTSHVPHNLIALL